MTEKVLVTGGLGYIGSHTVLELIENGMEPIIVDNLSNSKSVVTELIKKIVGRDVTFINLDLADAESVKNFIKKDDRITNVIHFAAFKYVNESVRDPLKYYTNNIFSLLNVLNAFKERQLNFVFSSSCTVYGEPDALPITEQSSTKITISPYGSTKQIAENILKDVAKSHRNFKIVSLRYFNPVGGHSSGLIGELPLHIPQNLFPYITQTAIGIRQQLTVHGNDYNTPDGTCIRDYIHVVDLAQSHIKALEYLARSKNDAPNYYVYNIGTGKGYSVLEIIKTFEEVNKVKINYKIGPRRNGDIEKIWASTEAANKEIGWNARRTLEDMVRSSWEWEKNLKSLPTM